MSTWEASFPADHRFFDEVSFYGIFYFVHVRVTIILRYLASKALSVPWALESQRGKT